MHLIVLGFILSVIYLIYKKIKSNKSKPNYDLKNSFERRSEECPPFYLNGWLPVLESRDLKKSQVKAVFGFGNDLVIFRGVSGKVYVLDAYCPHLGANLGVGGTVIGEDIRCPFHGWKFNNSGKCTEVPGIEVINTPKAQIKVWDSLEVNGFICIWNDSNGDKPKWSVAPIEEISNKEFVYIGRWEHKVQSHVQEIMENNSDAVHFNHIHNVPEFLGSPLNKPPFYYDLILKYFYIDYELTFETCSESHISQMEYFSTYNAGPLKFNSNIIVKLFGPALGHLKAIIFGKIYVHSLAAVISVGPMDQRIVHHFYAKRYNLISYLITLYVRNFYALQVDRDVDIWNNKKFLRKPFLVKNESSIQTFRRWYKQFYPEQSK